MKTIKSKVEHNRNFREESALAMPLFVLHLQNILSEANQIFASGHGWIVSDVSLS